MNDSIQQAAIKSIKPTTMTPRNENTGGKAGVRGYLVQTLVALLKIAQSKHPFIDIVLEPSHASEQFDFVYTSSTGSNAVQVKSTINVFHKRDVEIWAKKMQEARKNEICTLVLVGNHHSNLAKLNKIDQVCIEKKNLDIDGLIGEAAHLLAKFIEIQNLNAGTAKDREHATLSVISKLMHYSTTSERLTREVFIQLMVQWIKDAPSKIQVFSKQGHELRNSLSYDWLRSGPPVAILQGLPGSGKTHIALAVAENAKCTIYINEPSPESTDPTTDILMTLASELVDNGLPELKSQLETGNSVDIFSTLLKILRNEKILIVIDEFQRLFSKEATKPAINWQNLIERLNTSNQAAGRLMLISNRAVKNDRWCERCISREVSPLTDTEAAAYLLERLKEKNLVSKVPIERLEEVGHRMGGNPRALGTLAECLTYDSLEDLISISPALFEAGDVAISHDLIEDFERTLIERTLSRMDVDLLQTMRLLSVHRRPFNKDAYVEISKPDLSAEELRKQLISRYLLVNTSHHDHLHPLAREISVTRLRESTSAWKIAHGFASNYHLRRFKGAKTKGTERYTASFSELRHHLFEAGRIEELYQSSKEFAHFVISQIPESTYSQTPVHTEILEERIALISALPTELTTRGLSYHLALCLKHRNKGNDYQTALFCARRAIEPKAYYAVWLLLIELEHALNGIDAMLSVHAEALKYLGSGNNAFAVFHLTANLLGKDGRPDLAIAILEEGLSTPDIKCVSALASLCSTFMDRLGRTDEAIMVLLRLINTPNTPRLWEIYVQCARLMTKADNQPQAISLLKKGISDPNVNSLHNLYLLLAELLNQSCQTEDAIRFLKKGMSDARIFDRRDMLCMCAGLMAKCDSIKAAISLLEEGISSGSFHDVAPLFHKAAAIYEDSGDLNKGIDFLKRGMQHSGSLNDASIYLVCAKHLFHLRDIDTAVNILRQGLSKPKMKHKDQLHQMCADLLAREGKLDEAILLLENGITQVDSINTAYLYQKGAELLEKSEKPDQAIAFLLRGINAPALTNKVVLYQACAKLLKKVGRTSEGIILIERAIRMPGITGLANLYQTCAKLMASIGRHNEAIDILSGAINNPNVSNVLSLHQLCADLMISSGDSLRALTFLESSIEKYPQDPGLSSLYSRATAL